MSVNGGDEMLSQTEIVGERDDFDWTDSQDQQQSIEPGWLKFKRIETLNNDPRLTFSDGYPRDLFVNQINLRENPMVS